jgi:hypothetical protein
MDLERRRVRLAGWILGRHMRPAADARGPCSVSNAARPTNFEEVKCEQPNHTESDNQHREGYRIAWDSSNGEAFFRYFAMIAGLMCR